MNVAGGTRIALWVLSARQAARLMEALGAVEPPRAVPAQRSVERANMPLLPGGAGQPKAGGGGQPRASSEAPAQDSEAGKAEPEDGGDLNWI